MPIRHVVPRGGAIGTAREIMVPEICYDFANTIVPFFSRTWTVSPGP
jgi:hypothetical protein